MSGLASALSLGLGLALFLAGPAATEDGAPATQLRALCTDRPTKSTAPCTVDAGHVQIESDLFNITIDRTGGATTTTYLVTNPTVKLGISRHVEIELNLVPFEVLTTRDRATGATTRQSGIGDLFARVKWNLLGDDGGNVALALSPFIKAPTARIGLGNGAVEGGVIAPVTLNLPMKWSLTLDPELDIRKNGAGGGRHLGASGLVSLSWPVSGALTLSAELWSDVDLDPQGRRTQVSADLGAAWIPPRRPNLQFDAGVNLGLNRVTPGVQAYVGISRRF